MAASNTRFTQNRLGQSKNPIDSDHGIYRYSAANSSRCWAAVAWPLAARTEQNRHQRRVGVLMTTSREASLPLLTALTDRLFELSASEGKTVTIDDVWTEGRFDRLESLAVELVQRRPDVIVAPTTVAVSTRFKAMPSWWRRNRFSA